MNEQAIFLAALDIADPVQRAEYVNRACDGDFTLRTQVEALLAAHERSGEFLDVPALKQMTPADPTAETYAESIPSPGEIDLSFLEPATAPGSPGRLGHYEVREVIGRGACGVVLKAFDTRLERIVAIKVMAPELAATSPARKRFLREARATAAVRHDNVVNIYAVEEQPLPFLVMEYIDGETLQQRLDRTGPLDVRDVLRIGRQIAGGLAAAHDKGLIHRDIKPGNILLEEGTDHLKITDFGLARSMDDASMTQSGMIAGTPLYMSPEQVQAKDIDHRSDLFSLGSVLYVMCSGRPPFRAATTIAVLRRVVEDQPRPVQNIIPEVPGWLVAIITRLHAKEPAERFSSARETADLLKHCLSELEQRGRVESLGDVGATGGLPASASGITPGTGGQAASGTPFAQARRRWITAAVLMAVLLAGFGMTEATGVTNVRGTVIRLFSPEGTLVVEVDDPSVNVTIDGEELVITGAGAGEIRLKPGQYKLLASKDGKVVRQELVTVTTNGRQVVRVSQELGPVARTPGTAESDRDPPYVGQGDWRLEGDELVQAQLGHGISVLMFGDPAWTDYDVSVETMTTRGPKDAQGANLLFRARTPNDYLALFLGDYGGKFNEIYHRENGKWGRKVNPVPAVHETNRWYAVRIEARGPRFRCWLDDQLVFDFEEAGFPRGRIGLCTWKPDSVVRWRNLQVTSPEGHVLYKGFPQLPASAGHGKTAPPALPSRFTNSLGMEFALVPKGKAWLGGSDGRPGNQEVDFRDDFYLGVYEVTQEEWNTLMTTNNSFFSRAQAGESVEDIPDADLKRFPVDTVNWDDIQLFLKELNLREKDSGWVYRLPTEAEWEYACRGGPVPAKAESAFDFYLARPSTQLVPDQANAGGVLKRTCPVGSYPPNRLGLYDMHGNVLEWCWDELPPDPKDPKAVPQRVLRGGCWSLATTFARAADRRTLGPPDFRHNDRGLRVARIRVQSADPDRRAAEWVLSMGGIVNANGQREEIQSASDLPREPFQLTSVILGGNSTVSDTGLAHFRDCKNLLVLSLWSTPVTDAGLVHFKDCRNLARLDLDGTRIGDAGLACFRDCTRLTSLRLSQTQITDESLTQIKNYQNLSQLHLACKQVTDAGLVHLKDCKTLTDLRLDGSQVSDAGLAHLKECSHLGRLQLGRTRVTDAALPHLKGLTELVLLDLRGTQVTAEGVKELAAALPRCRIEWDGGVIESQSGVALPWPSQALEALRRDQISAEALSFAGDGDPDKAPPTLVAVLGNPEPIHTTSVKVLAFSRDGRWLASGSNDRTVLLRDATTGRVVRALRAHEASITALAFTPDSGTVVSGDALGTVKFWSTDGEGEPTTVPLGVKPMQMAVSRDGRYLAAGGDGGVVKLWPWGQWDAPATLPVVTTGTLLTLAFSPDGEVLACGWIDNTPESPIALYKTSDGSLQQTLPGHEQCVASLSFSHDGKYLASAGGGEPKLWDLATGTSVEMPLRAQLLCFSPDSQKLFTAYRGGVHIYDVSSRALEKWHVINYVSGQFGGGYSLAMSPNGETLAVGENNGAVNFYDTATWKSDPETRELGHRSSITALAVSPDGTTVLSEGSDRTVRRCTLDDPNEHQLVQQFKASSNLLAYGPDGNTFAIGQTPLNNNLIVFNAETVNERFPVPIGMVSVAYSPDGKLLAAHGGHWDRTTHLWDVQLGREVHRFPKMIEDHPCDLAYSADGRLLAVAGMGGNVVCWNVSTGEKVASWKDAPVRSVAFTPDSSGLATGHENGTIIIWDAATGTKTRTINASRGPVSSLKFTPDGQTLLSSGTDGVVQVRNPEQDRARMVIPVGPPGVPVVFDLDASGQYLFASGPTPLIYVHRLPLSE